MTALVTGATSGIGAAFARQLAAEGMDLVLVARDMDRLEGTAASLRDRYGVEVEVISADLAFAETTLPVQERVASTERPIDLLVNNAGIGLRGKFWETPLADQERMFHLNCTAVLRLSHAALGAMVPRGRGDIIVVSSVSGFAPSVRGAYGASKAWATAFAESLTGALAGTGVHASAVAPGFVRTEFHGRAGLEMSKVPEFMWLDAEEVAAAALRDHRAGKVVSVPGAQYKAIVAASRLVPPSVNRRVTELFRRRAL
ncbi:MAG TPA: SDR family oxidoreductase [Mycobacteriales bacterium]|jgi:short-subunit dehydrogenase|nr:SDR family oxidoreductase [Mycobacteriales bacterium]